MKEFAIQTNQLTKRFSSLYALKNLDLNIKHGSIIGLIGRSGSGKTTLLKICAGLLSKTSGDVLVLKQDPIDQIEILNQLIYSKHNIQYVKRYTLKDILAQYQQMFVNFDKNFAEKMMQFFRLNHRSKYEFLSQGNQSCFNFVCAIASRATITLLDEPVLGMDIAMRKSVYEIILRDQIEFPRTIVISSHLLAELEGILSEIILIEQGKLVFHKDIDEVREMAYRIDGPQEEVAAFCSNRNVISQRNQEMFSSAVILEKVSEAAEAEANRLNLTISKVTPSDLCVYITKSTKEGELECLWDNQN